MGDQPSGLHHHSVDSAGLHRARQAAEQARGVAAAVAVATAAAADRACFKHHHGIPHDSASDGASNRERGQNLVGGSDNGSWRGTPQRLTERALQLHESRSVSPSAHVPQRRGSRFVPDALPFHCAADYSHAGPRALGPVAAQSN